MAGTPFLLLPSSRPTYHAERHHVRVSRQHRLRGHWGEPRQPFHPFHVYSLALTLFSGIGLGLTKALLARPATTIIATAREPAITILNTELASSPTGAGSIYHVFELDAGSLPSPAIIRERFLDETKLSSVDILIANAGMATSLGAALDVTAADLQTHFAVNATAPLMNFQALWPLMRETKAPKLFSISSSVGCIEMSELPGGAYGPSKAALNWITKRLHCEGANDGLVSVAVHPG